MKTINQLLKQMHDEKLTAAQVVDRADEALRETQPDADCGRAVSIGAMKVQLAFALDEILTLRKRISEFEEIKFDSEADVYSEEKTAA